MIQQTSKVQLAQPPTTERLPNTQRRRACLWEGAANLQAVQRVDARGGRQRCKGRRLQPLLLLKLRQQLPPPLHRPLHRPLPPPPPRKLQQTKRRTNLRDRDQSRVRTGLRGIVQDQNRTATRRGAQRVYRAQSWPKSVLHPRCCTVLNSKCQRSTLCKRASWTIPCVPYPVLIRIPLGSGAAKVTDIPFLVDLQDNGSGNREEKNQKKSQKGKKGEKKHNSCTDAMIICGVCCCCCAYVSQVPSSLHAPAVHAPHSSPLA